MSYAREAGLTLKRQADELATLSKSVGLAQAVTLEFVRTLIAYMIRADGSTGSEELILQAVFNNDDGFSWTEETEYTRDRVLDNSHFLRTVPKFLWAAKDNDDRHGSQIAPAMIKCIDAMCATICGIDGQYHPDELENRAVLLATLNTAIDRDGEPWLNGQGHR
jgi:hypothetical protein